MPPGFLSPHLTFIYNIHQSFRAFVLEVKHLLLLREQGLLHISALWNSQYTVAERYETVMSQNMCHSQGGSCKNLLNVTWQTWRWLPQQYQVLWCYSPEMNTSEFGFYKYIHQKIPSSPLNTEHKPTVSLLNLNDVLQPRSRLCNANISHVLDVSLMRMWIVNSGTKV